MSIAFLSGGHDWPPSRPKISTCKYYREDEITMYEPECTGDSNSAHEQDIEGDYCPYCGRKIEFMEFTTPPES